MSGSTALKRPPHIPNWVQIRSFLSRQDPIGNVRGLSRVRVPRDRPRSSSRFAKSHPRRRAVQSTDPSRPCGLSCGCDFAVRYEAIGCSLRSLPHQTSVFLVGPLLTSPRRANFFQKPQSFYWLLSYMLRSALR